MTERHARCRRVVEDCAIALVAASPRIVGGQGVQAQILSQRTGARTGTTCARAIDPLFPSGLRCLRRLAYARTALNQGLYLPSLSLRGVDAVHVFSASY